MTEPGLNVTAVLPFACQAGLPTAAASYGSLLLLRLVNLLEAGDAEPERTQERVEAKLDLMLHWLGLQLYGNQPMPDTVALRLEADRIVWSGAAPAAGQAVSLHLHIHPAVAAPLVLAGRMVQYKGERAEAELAFDTEELAEAWTQWLFRRHRRAVHEARRHPV